MRISVWNVRWKLSSNFAKQISRNRLQFDFRLVSHCHCHVPLLLARKSTDLGEGGVTLFSMYYYQSKGSMFVPWVFISTASLPCLHSEGCRLMIHYELLQECVLSPRVSQPMAWGPLVSVFFRANQILSLKHFNPSLYDPKHCMHECTNRLQQLQACLFWRYTHSHPRNVWIQIISFNHSDTQKPWHNLVLFF